MGGRREQEAGLEELRQRLARYERILRENGLLEEDGFSGRDTTLNTGFAELSQLPIFQKLLNRSRSTPGILLGNTKDTSQFVDSHLWRSLGDEEMQRMSEDAGTNESSGRSDDREDPPDPLTEAFLGDTTSYPGTREILLQHQPTAEHATFLWQTYLQNVDPLCRILHVPTTNVMIEQAWQKPELISKADQCLIFSIYHFAVFSLSEEESAERLGQSRTVLLQRYSSATRKALVNASFLETTSMTILQALVLLLIPCRHIYDPSTYWILTGVAVRIGQRMGLHRDGETMGLSPFQTEMRRRLFWSLLPIDSSAAQISGVGASITPESWDTQLPRNLNDDQVWPGMAETPVEQSGVTDMIFSLSRFCIGKHLARVGGPAALGNPNAHSSDVGKAKKFIREAEAEIEEKLIRYCDVLNPVHFLSMSLARAGILAMRWKIRLPAIRNQTAMQAEVREALHLAGKIMDTDAAINVQGSVMKRFHWHARPFFVWGMWDSFIFVLMTLWKRCDLLSTIERDEFWGKVERVYLHHAELLLVSQSQPMLYVGSRRLTLKAWDTQSSKDDCGRVPGFIERLRALCDKDMRKAEAPPIAAEDRSVPSMSHPDLLTTFDLDDIDWASTWGLFMNGDAGS
ncbi:fungal specific transcription factor domain-containing protein [Aspergillus stella-maris]|uniref:fungal specific transcription factor domain-containing protein n=1 Tax=Aspergillus stella-maris TaxID=1810926 RepID=UPI003CCD39F0